MSQEFVADDEFSSRLEALSRRPARRPAREVGVRSKPVRVTVDLAPQTHRMLAAYCEQLSQEIHAPRVTQAQVLRALIERLENDARVRDAVLKIVTREINER